MSLISINSFNKAFVSNYNPLFGVVNVFLTANIQGSYNVRPYNKYYLCTFTGDGNITFSTDVSAHILAVGGGGGGGSIMVNNQIQSGGGGGAGSVGIGDFFFEKDITYYITIGNGGTPGNNGSDTELKKGTPSTLIFKSYGGGYGSSRTTTSNTPPWMTWGNGGSGGGAGSISAGIWGSGSVISNSYPNMIFYGLSGGLVTTYVAGGGGGAGGNFNTGEAGPGKIWYVNNQIYGRGGYGGRSGINPSNAVVGVTSGIGAGYSTKTGGPGIPSNSGNGGGGGTNTRDAGPGPNYGGSGASGVFIIACY